jgi:hypothetical protein
LIQWTLENYEYLINKYSTVMFGNSLEVINKIRSINIDMIQIGVMVGSLGQRYRGDPNIIMDEP